LIVSNFEVDIQDRDVEVRGPDAFDAWDRNQHVLNEIKDELEHFINDTPINLPKGTTALNWWLIPANQLAYPCLYRMAVDILSIPPMSAEPERIFSGARRTISWERYCLGAENIERGECLKSWLKSGLVDSWRAELLQQELRQELQQEGGQEGGEDIEMEGAEIE
jgi:hypothetical protein